MRYNFRAVFYSLLGVVLLAVTGCNKKSTAHIAFYSWKTSFDPDTAQLALLKNTAGNHLYLRFFDIVWNEQLHEAVPEAVVTVKQNIKGLVICPVIYITNKTFEHTGPEQADALALKANRLAGHLAEQYQISYQHIQIDCDWTAGTKNSYFSFLKAFKKYNHRQLEATVRLHQIKYPERTGIPPVDKGLLMFYNMGKLSADLHARNSIYNAEDAEKYISFLPHYRLPLDIALPIFSWSVQIREGRMIQVYGKISKKELSDIHNFQQLEQKNVYSAKKSFYLEGIYVKSGDLFKFEGLSPESLNTAAKQVSPYLAPLENRNIIYYEISSVNLSSFHAKDIQEVSAHF
jgi:hypothetical protein